LFLAESGETAREKSCPRISPRRRIDAGVYESFHQHVLKRKRACEN